jgi:predicted MPP superfamily phosphohydrolase
LSLAGVLRAAAFLIGALAVSAAVHGYLFARLVRDTRLPREWPQRARNATVVLALLLPGGMVGLLTMHDTPRGVAAPLMWAAFGWLGVLLFLLPTMFASEIVRAWQLRRDPGAPTDPDRRRAIARAIGAVSGAASVALAAGSAVVAQLPPVTRRVRIPLPGLGAALNGYRIVQISDVHVSATIGRALVESLVERVNALEPDLVAITGDLVDGSVNGLGELVAPLAGLRARDGVYFVTGNHEYLSGVEEWLLFLASLGIRVLRNERVAIGGVEGFDLIGIDDTSGGSWLPGHGADLPRAVAGRDPARASVLLAHRPDDVAEAARSGIGFQLSGHTHGGQISPLWWVLERLHQPYVYGLHTVGETTLYVTSGAGFWGPPMRCGSRAEIAAFELVAPDTSL